MKVRPQLVLIISALLTACAHMPVPSNRYKPPPNNAKIELTSTDLEKKAFLPFFANWSVETSFYTQTQPNSCPKFDAHHADSGYLFTASLNQLKGSRSIRVPAEKPYIQK